MRPDPECPWCGGSGERFFHTEGCESDFCALAGGIDDCPGQVEECPCALVIPTPPREAESR